MKSKKGERLPSSSSLLSTAIKDLEVQMGALKRDKTQMQGDLKKTSSAIDVDRELEKSLQEKIARLIEKEAKLNEKKKKLTTQIDQVSDKLNKVAKIKSEMSDI